jgi:hypothetical protein
MPQFEIICLANSRKHGERCVAGLRTDGSGWLRPVGTVPEGTLYPPPYTLHDGTEAGLLDVIRVGVRTHRPVPRQPENWVIDGTMWALNARPLRDNLSHGLRNAIVSGPELLRGSRIGCPMPVSSSRMRPHPSLLSHRIASICTSNRATAAGLKQEAGSRLEPVARLPFMTSWSPIPAGNNLLSIKVRGHYDKRNQSSL